MLLLGAASRVYTPVMVTASRVYTPVIVIICEYMTSFVAPVGLMLTRTKTKYVFGLV
jgi:hypothetical protein